MAKLQASLEAIYKSDNLPEYYNGNNCDVFFDNIYVDECTMINYRSVINSAPTYAYNQGKFNSIAQGNFRVEGTFAVNFKATGYIEYILQQGQVQREAKTYQPLGRVSPINTKAGIRSTTSNRIMNTQSTDFLNSAIFNPRASQITDAEMSDVRAKLRDLIWGHLNVADELSIQSLKDAIVGKYFDILILIGNPNTDSYDVKNIVDAQVLDVSLQVVPDMPLQLVYTFVARDVDRPSASPNPFDFIQSNTDIIQSVQIGPAQFLESMVELVDIFTKLNMFDTELQNRNFQMMDNAVLLDPFEIVNRITEE
jgi:hypothetical protein